MKAQWSGLASSTKKQSQSPHVGFYMNMMREPPNFSLGSIRKSVLFVNCCYGS